MRQLDPKDYSAFGAYSVSKAANVLFTVELQRRFDAAGLAGSAVALHPGMVQTALTRYIIGGKDAGDTRLSETVAPPTCARSGSHALRPYCSAALTCAAFGLSRMC